MKRGHYIFLYTVYIILEGTFSHGYYDEIYTFRVFWFLHGQY